MGHKTTSDEVWGKCEIYTKKVGTSVASVSFTQAKLGQVRQLNTRFAWAGGTFFPVVLLCQFFVLVGNRFWLYILLST